MDKDIARLAPAWGRCCGLCGIIREPMKKCPHCGCTKYCSRTCLEDDYRYHQPFCQPDLQYGIKTVKTKTVKVEDEDVPDFLIGLVQFFESYNISTIHSKLLISVLSKCNDLRISEQIEDLTVSPLGKLIGVKLYKDVAKIEVMLREAYKQFHHPFFTFGIEIMEGVKQYYDDHPDQVSSTKSYGSFAPPNNINDWFK